MKALLITKTEKGDLVVEKIITLKDDYDGNPNGDTVPLTAKANQFIEVILDS